MKRFFRRSLIRLMLIDRKTGIVTKTAVVTGLIIGSVANTFAQIPAGDTIADGGLMNKIWGIVRFVRNALIAVTIGTTAWGAFTVTNAFMNDKQNAQDTLKKFLIGIGISAAGSVVLTMIYNNAMNDSSLQ